jgi:peptide/nickel transport system permease protein
MGDGVSAAPRSGAAVRAAEGAEAPDDRPAAVGLGARSVARRRNWRRHTPVIAVVALLAAVMLLGDTLAPYPVDVPDYTLRLHSPSWQHPFGTDELGRDLFSRVLVGTRLSLGAALAAEALVVTVGIVVGLVAGYRGGLVDDILMRITDVFISFPAILLAMSVVAALGIGLGKVVIAVSFTWWPYYARLTRGEVLSVKERDYVLAARALGARESRVMVAHVLRNSLTPIIVQLTIGIGAALVTISGLSFLGFGAQPPTPEWGALISSGFRYILVAPWYATAPGVVIVLVVLVFFAAGDALQGSGSRS